MRILLLNYEFPPMGGGAGNATSNIARELAAMGHGVDVLTSRLAGQPSEEDLDGYRVYRVSSWRKGIHDCGLRGAFTYVLSALPVLRALAREWRYDVVHYFFSLPTGLLSLAPGAHRKIPYIVSLRGSDVPHYDDFNRGLQLFHALLLPVTRRIWRRSARVVALSEGLRSEALLTLPSQRIDVISNGVETDLFTPGKERREKDGPIRMITVSRLIERKGIQHVLEAISRMGEQNIELLIVGTGSYETHLKELCGKLGLDGKVTFHGFCLRSRLPELYRRSDLFILPSMAESFGIVFAEAMACGLPVIGGRTGGVVDLVKEENGILVPPGDVAAIRAAVKKLCDSPEMRRAMGRANRERAVDRYGWRRVAEEYGKIYAREAVV